MSFIRNTTSFKKTEANLEFNPNAFRGLCDPQDLSKSAVKIVNKA